MTQIEMNFQEQEALTYFASSVSARRPLSEIEDRVANSLVSKDLIRMGVFYDEYILTEIAAEWLKEHGYISSYTKSEKLELIHCKNEFEEGIHYEKDIHDSIVNSVRDPHLREFVNDLLLRWWQNPDQEVADLISNIENLAKEMQKLKLQVKRSFELE